MPLIIVETFLRWRRRILDVGWSVRISSKYKPNKGVVHMKALIAFLDNQCLNKQKCDLNRGKRQAMRIWPPFEMICYCLFIVNTGIFEL